MTKDEFIQSGLDFYEPEQYKLRPDQARYALMHGWQQQFPDRAYKLKDVVLQEQTIYGPRYFTMRGYIKRAFQ